MPCPSKRAADNGAHQAWFIVRRRDKIPKRILATWLVNKGTDVETVRGLLRHANVTTTFGKYAQTADVEYDGRPGSGAAGYEVRQPGGELAGDFAAEFLRTKNRFRASC